MVDLRVNTANHKLGAQKLGFSGTLETFIGKKKISVGETDPLLDGVHLYHFRRAITKNAITDPVVDLKAVLGSSDDGKAFGILVKNALVDPVAAVKDVLKISLPGGKTLVFLTEKGITFSQVTPLGIPRTNHILTAKNTTPKILERALKLFGEAKDKLHLKK